MSPLGTKACDFRLPDTEGRVVSLKKRSSLSILKRKKISLLDKNPAPGTMFTRRPTSPVGENTRKYTMSTSEAFRGELIR
jgi:hypothetical protein